MLRACFFLDARLNFAENLLRRRDDGDALVFLPASKVFAETLEVNVSFEQ